MNNLTCYILARLHLKCQLFCEEVPPEDAHVGLLLQTHQADMQASTVADQQGDPVLELRVQDRTVLIVLLISIILKLK